MPHLAPDVSPPDVSPPDTSWRRRAACRSHSDDLFFGPDGESRQRRAEREAAAVRVCRGCPVRAACLRHAVTAPERAGVWGGMGEDRRAALVRGARADGG